MIVRKFKYFMGDFETTVFDGQDRTEVWASAVVPFGSEKVEIFHSIAETLDYLISLNDNVCIYYHNLKFDGEFWLSYLLCDLGWEQAYRQLDDKGLVFEWLQEKEMRNKTFKYSITKMGQWYTIILKVNNHIIEIRDSLKLLPFSVKRIGDSFKTKHKKLDMEYTGYRYSGCEITDEEKEYISNDVLVVKEALEIMFEEGHNKLTIGSCCLDEYKKIMGKDYDILFPNLYDIPLDETVYGYPTAGHYIRKSYKGGWCHVVKGKQKIVYTRGSTFDVNSLYPSVMHSESGNRYPIGTPTFWKGNYVPEARCYDDAYFFIRIKTRFYLKDGYLPFIQIKDNLLYNGNECLESSDVFDADKGEYFREYIDLDGVVQQARVTLTLTMTDYILFLEHYRIEDFEILDGCYFGTLKGIFDAYINRYKELKQNSKGARRESAKLFLNNLYGKMRANTDSSFKVAFIKEDKTIGYIIVTENKKKAGYIAVGSAITSYARNFTIRARQKNYYGVDKDGFIYRDTDSIHCSLLPHEIVGIRVHDTEFNCWKNEAVWDEAIFTRQKTYIEHVVEENGEQVEPYYNVKCAGMPERCKKLFLKSMEYGKTGVLNLGEEKYTREEIDFISTPRTIENFEVGLIVPSKLRPKRINGGVLLVNTTYQMR